ncbi:MULTISPECIES: histidine kinase [Roseivirga]|uniref:Histidine kinase n=1 Tax=Roseivirga thermotolerans TaxID=1758176 RepID=A0ABQ3I5C4_9BACT|nr:MULTISPECIES: histidine kinase [Roseivirga]MEC7755282.1 histidine kinase [Bacteroidota bacterium]GHE54993.1 histidine kinase [Roseivirga thermotolerans]
MNKNKLYWILQFGGWTGLMLTSFMTMAMFLPFVTAFGVNTITILLSVLTSHLYREYVKSKNWKELKVARLVPRVFLASIIQGTIMSVLSLGALIGALLLMAKVDPSAMDKVMGIPEMEGVDEATLEKIRAATQKGFTSSKILVFLISYVGSYAVYFISWSALYFAYQYLQKTREVEIEKWKLSASIKDAELNALKAQINPHFIFNSLNNIRSLVVEDSEKARDSITHLSDLLRFSIQFDQYEKVSLEKELEVVKDYLNLEAIQLEERLKYRFIIDKQSKETMIPPMIIQTLVENAIKHSINNLPNGGEIIVESKLNHEFVNIYVKNTGQLRPHAATKGRRRGIGISNSKERLRLLYGEQASLTIENMNENMVCATVKVPLNFT